MVSLQDYLDETTIENAAAYTEKSAKPRSRRAIRAAISDGSEVEADGLGLAEGAEQCLAPAVDVDVDPGGAVRQGHEAELLNFGAVGLISHRTHALQGNDRVGIGTRQLEVRSERRRALLELHRHAFLHPDLDAGLVDVNVRNLVGELEQARIGAAPGQLLLDELHELVFVSRDLDVRDVVGRRRTEGERAGEEAADHLRGRRQLDDAFRILKELLQRRDLGGLFRLVGESEAERAVLQQIKILNRLAGERHARHFDDVHRVRRIRLDDALDRDGLLQSELARRRLHLVFGLRQREAHQVFAVLDPDLGDPFRRHEAFGKRRDAGGEQRFQAEELGLRELEPGLGREQESLQLEGVAQGEDFGLGGGRQGLGRGVLGLAAASRRRGDAGRQGQEGRNETQFSQMQLKHDYLHNRFRLEEKQFDRDERIEMTEGNTIALLL